MRLRRLRRWGRRRGECELETGSGGGIRSEGSRNAHQISAQSRNEVTKHLEDQLSPEQVAASINISHETIYRHIYADKALGGGLWRHLRCQKKRRKTYLGRRQRCGKIADRRRISERPTCIEKRRQIGHRGGDTSLPQTTNKPSSASSSVRRVTLFSTKFRERPVTWYLRRSSDG